MALVLLNITCLNFVPGDTEMLATSKVRLRSQYRAPCSLLQIALR